MRVFDRPARREAHDAAMPSLYRADLAIAGGGRQHNASVPEAGGEEAAVTAKREAQDLARRAPRPKRRAFHQALDVPESDAGRIALGSHRLAIGPERDVHDFPRVSWPVRQHCACGDVQQLHCVVEARHRQRAAVRAEAQTDDTRLFTVEYTNGSTASEVPQGDGPGAPACSQGAIGMKGHAVDLTCTHRSIAEHHDVGLPSRIQAPHENLATPVSGHEDVAARLEPHRLDLAEMPVKGDEAPRVLDIVEDELQTGAGREARAVGAERHFADALQMLFELLRFVTFRQVPEQERAIASSSHDLRAVGMNRQRRNPAVRSRQES